MPDARRRRDAVVRIIAEQEIRTQDDLVAALEAEGFRASQASVSRDIAALGLVKSRGRYVRPGRKGRARSPEMARLHDSVLGAERAGDHLVVLTTPPGEASPVAIAIDRAGWPGVVGTVAGDDTIFVAVAGAAHARDLVRKLSPLG